MVAFLIANLKGSVHHEEARSSEDYFFTFVLFVSYVVHEDLFPVICKVL